MAFSYGSVTNCKVANGQTRSEYQCRLGYQVNSQSIANNTSNVTLRLQVRSTSSSYKTYGYNQTTKIDGTSLSAKSFDMRSTNVWQVFGERTITVSHNSEGKYSASKSGSFTTTASSGYSLKSGSASVTVAPATIPRYATSNQSLNSKTSSSIKMNWSSDSTVDYIWYSKDNGSNWTGVDVTDGTSGTYTISGLSANTTYNIKTRVRRKDSQLTTDSSTLAVTTYQKTTASISVSSKTETSVTVTSSSNVTASSTKYRIMKSGGSYGSWQTSNTFSGLSANSTYTVQVEKVGQASGETGYVTVSVTTYAYPYCTSAPNFTIGKQLTIQLYNPLNRTVQIQMWSHVSKSFVSDLITINGTSYTGFADIATRLYQSIPNNTESTYNIDVHYGSNKAIKEGGKYSTNGTEKPIFNNFTYEDTNEVTKALTGNNQILINGYSNLKATISVSNKAYSNYYSPIIKYRLNVGNMSSVESNYSSDKAVEMSINSINNPSIIVTAIDGRNYSTPVTETATFKSYTKPIITALEASRNNGGVGSQVTLDFDGTWWNDNFGKVDNTIKNIEYYYKKTTDNNWTKGNTTITASTNDSNFFGSVVIDGPNSDDKGFDASTAYNIKLLVTDELATSTEYQTTLGSGTPAIAILGSSVAIGQMYNEDLGGTLQVDGYDVSNKFKQYLPLIGGTLTGETTMNKSSGDTFYHAYRTDTGTGVSMGIGAGGVNHGIYSRKLNKWMLYGDGSNVYVNNYKINSASTKGVKTLSSKSDGGWSNQTDGDAYLITKAFMAYWNGAYSGKSSNLTYCSGGEIMPKGDISCSIWDKGGWTKIAGKLLVQWGEGTGISISANSVTDKTITFHQSFTKTPLVFIQPCGNYDIVGQVNDISNTNFIARIRNRSSSAVSNRWFNWFAIGM